MLFESMQLNTKDKETGLSSTQKYMMVFNNLSELDKFKEFNEAVPKNSNLFVRFVFIDDPKKAHYGCRNQYNIQIGDELSYSYDLYSEQKKLKADLPLILKNIEQLEPRAIQASPNAFK